MFGNIFDFSADVQHKYSSRCGWARWGGGIEGHTQKKTKKQQTLFTASANRSLVSQIVVCAPNIFKVSAPHIIIIIIEPERGFKPHTAFSFLLLFFCCFFASNSTSIKRKPGFRVMANTCPVVNRYPGFKSTWLERPR